MTSVKTAVNSAVCALTSRAGLIRMAFIVLLLSYSGLVVAASEGSTQITATLTSIYCLLKDLVPLMAFTLFVLAGVAYGAGNFFGAEVRAKANSWAMSCITGGIIALLIILFSNILISNLMPGFDTSTLSC